MKRVKASRAIVSGIFIAVAASASAPMTAHAQSAVTLYGDVDNAINYTSNQKGKHNFYLSQGELNASKFGLLGSEDLGGGLKTIFRLESGFNSLTGAQSSAGVEFNRQAYVGLSDQQFGTLTIGRQYTPYFNFVGALGPTGYLTGATGAHPGDLDALDTTLRFNNSLTYTSPVLSGLQASAQYGLGGVAGNFTHGNTLSAALTYAVANFRAAVGYVRLADLATSNALATVADNSPVNVAYATAHTNQMIAAAAQYKSGNFMVGANYSNVLYRPGAGSTFRDTAVFNTYGVISTYQVTPAINVAAGYSYTRASESNGIADSARYNQFSLEQSYSMTKRTAIYFLEGYQHASGKAIAANGTSIVDAVAVVGDGQNTTPSSGGSQFVGSVGLRHFF
ncbi:porin [Paraburkholderia sp. BCC1885]|uniref:porin n=1 Tax=Paraburkholderia sp. BCC1885 TaxID=2562669 RepID=UPI00391F6BA9